MAERGTGNEQAVAAKLLAAFEAKHPEVLEEPAIDDHDDGKARTKNDGLRTWRGVNRY